LRTKQRLSSRQNVPAQKKLGKCPLVAKVLLCGRHALLWLSLVTASASFYNDVGEKEKYFCPKPKQ